MPFGEVRTEVGTISQTDFGYTGQRSISMLSIMDYIARMYDPAIGRFIQPDTIIPSPANPQSWNRYSYVLNNPVRYSDPSGHRMIDDECGMNGEDCGERVPASIWNQPENNRDDENGISASRKSRSKGGGNKDEGCEKGDAICQLRNYHDLDDPELWNHIALVTQDMATVASSLGALVTIGSTIFGCVGGTEAGVLPGCAAGYTAGRIFHLGVTNPFETALSFASLLATSRYESLTGDTRIGLYDPRTRVVGEATKTSSATFISGSLVTEPILDAAIDIYASGFNHGAFCGISTILACLP